MSLKDKVIFISGGSRGIGLAMAKKAAHDGAKLLLLQKPLIHIQNYLELYILLPMKLLKQEVMHCLSFAIFEVKTMLGTP